MSRREPSKYFRPGIATFGTLVMWDTRFQNERLHCKAWGGSEPSPEPSDNYLTALNSPPVSADSLRLEVGLEMLNDGDGEVTE